MNRSEDRFTVEYSIKGKAGDAHERAREICIEQTVEFPPKLIADKHIREAIIGRIENFSSLSAMHHRALISYADSTAGRELTQLLNVLFGNTSLKPGIRIEMIDFSKTLLGIYKGPRFGIEGIRKLARVWDRPLLASALKPMGLSPEKLADLAYALAESGIDIIKDDHGLADQEFARFLKRVTLCSRAVTKANAATGGSVIYAPNVTADGAKTVERAHMAKDAGALALVVSPGLAGFNTIRELREDSSIGLPVFSHPALLGSFVAGRYSGISHHTIFGQIPRLLGADASIFPNFGGRFAFTRADCASIVDGLTVSLGDKLQAFPMPGGGINLSSIRMLKKFYGNDVVFLVGGGLFEYDSDISKSVARFRELIS